MANYVKDGYLFNLTVFISFNLELYVLYFYMQRVKSSDVPDPAFGSGTSLAKTYKRLFNFFISGNLAARNYC